MYDNKKIIGTKMNKRGVIINLIIIFIHTSFWTFLGIYMGIGNFLNLDSIVRIFWLLTSTLILLLIQLPIIGATQRIEYSNEIIEFYSVKGYINQFKEVIYILINKPSDPDISILIKEVNAVKLSYRKTYGGYGIMGYALVLLFFMKNGTIISLSPENMSRPNDGAYHSLLNMLEKNNIEIVDDLNLKAGLIKDAKYFQKHIKKTVDKECVK